jgi:hypothetical protein
MLRVYPEPCVFRYTPGPNGFTRMTGSGEEVTALQPATIRPEAERVIDFIRAMPKDDERFADCRTFDDYWH